MCKSKAAVLSQLEGEVDHVGLWRESLGGGSSEEKGSARVLAGASSEISLSARGARIGEAQGAETRGRSDPWRRRWGMVVRLMSLE